MIKSIQIDKLPTLRHFIFSHQKKEEKKKEEKTTIPQTSIEVTISKEKELKKVYDKIVKDTTAAMIDISNDYFKDIPEDESKKYKG